MVKKIHLYFILLTGAFIRLYFVLSSHYMSPDGTQYAGIGYNLFHFLTYQSNGAQFPDIVQPPLYPIFSGLYTLFFTMEYAAKFVSFIFGIIFILLVYRFTCDVTKNKTLSLFAAWIAALHPALILVSSEAATESMYLFWVLAGVSAGWKYINKPELKLVLLSSFFWLMAFLTRVEGIVFFFVQFVILFMWVWKKQNRMHMFYYVVLLLTGLTIYMHYTAKELGYITPSPKLKLIRAHARLYNQYKDEIKKLPRIQAEQKVRYSLVLSGKELAANAILFKHENIKPSADQNKKKPALIFGIVKRIVHNLQYIPMKLKNGFAFPLVFLMVLFLAFMLFWKPKPSFLLAYKKNLPSRFVFYLLGMSIGAFSFLVSHVEDRFLYTLVLFLIMPAADGAMLFYSVIKERLRFPLLQKFAFPLMISLIFLLSVYSYQHISQKHHAKDYYYSAGLQLKKMVDPQDTIAAVTPQAVFFAQAKYSVLPSAPVDKLRRFFKYNSIKYVLLEQKDLEHIPVARQVFEAFQCMMKFTVQSKRFYLLITR